jgi:hypothetical protein
MARPQKTWGFQERETAEQLKRMVGNVDVEYVEGKVRQSVVAKTQVFFTPSGGIAARSGATLGSATCTRISVTSGTRASTGSMQTVYNHFRSAVAGSTDVIASLIDGIWVVISEDCAASSVTSTNGDSGVFTVDGGGAALSAADAGVYAIIAEQYFISMDLNGSGGPLEPV